MQKLTSNFFLFLCLLYSQINLAQTHKDCETALKLCGESPFYIANAEGIGMEDTGIDTTCVGVEIGSIWFTWTVVQGGILTFELIPNHEEQDLDFVVYKLNVANDCEDKEVIRCMASGRVEGSPPSQWEICTGSTGLAIGEIDTEENAGCSKTDNNFLAPLQTNQGDQYIMLVNDFFEDEMGFALSFGGSAILDCITTSTTDLKTTSGSEFEINPSISTGIITIKLMNEKLLGGQLLIYNMYGQLVYFDNPIRQFQYDVDLTNLPKGVYVATLKKGQLMTTKRLLITN